MKKTAKFDRCVDAAMENTHNHHQQYFNGVLKDFRGDVSVVPECSRIPTYILSMTYMKLYVWTPGFRMFLLLSLDLLSHLIS